MPPSSSSGVATSSITELNKVHRSPPPLSPNEATSEFKQINSIQQPTQSSSPVEAHTAPSARPLPEIISSSKLIRTKLRYKKADRKNDIAQQLKNNFWKTCQNIFLPTKQVSPLFDVDTGYTYYKSSAKNSGNNTFHKPDWIHSLQIPSQNCNSDPPSYNEMVSAIHKIKSKSSPCPLDQISIMTSHHGTPTFTYISTPPNLNINLNMKWQGTTSSLRLLKSSVEVASRCNNIPTNQWGVIRGDVACGRSLIWECCTLFNLRRHKLNLQDETGGEKVCGGEVCGGEVCGGEVCGGKVCGGEVCGGELCGGEVGRVVSVSVYHFHDPGSNSAVSTGSSG
ncbi:hypothetical protein HELRODRAFT_165498 [Helobdella robusta]|uniref:Uncharacterized protein n=1 Tax=Helobdella robusta TaxID=6412 RepID=T1EWX1_HELRO|nr:hypothetical protein HELRODRAFT_165498 [Helobdella robusta]ESN91461.1 hypothetical protein HELRODRAFT_165498 [Helobdella robusta]